MWLDRRSVAVCIAASMPLCLVTSAGAQSVEPPQPEIEDLGDQRYRIGEILIDQSAASFTVPGRVIRTDPALEYLAVTVGGAKAYESLLELDADAYQFNLACILIGLSNDDVVPPDFQFDTDIVIGPPVRIAVQWQEDGTTVEHDAADLLLESSERVVAGSWVYTGSTYVPGHADPYLASQAGTLIGLVHDPASIVEHRTGVGIGAYGSIAGNAELLGGVGRELTLTVEALSEPD
ncbi:MAG: YdjY domain-containing protein [Gammaproteobacteria bacterium]